MRPQPRINSIAHKSSELRSPSPSITGSVKVKVIQGSNLANSNGLGKLCASVWHKQLKQQPFKALPIFKPSQIIIRSAFGTLSSEGKIVRRQRLSLSKDLKSQSKSGQRSGVVSTPKKLGIHRVSRK